MSQSFLSGEFLPDLCLCGRVNLLRKYESTNDEQE